jgi:zinc transport system ATP-binding protein
MALISARNIGYRIAERVILHDVDFDIEQSQITTIIGPNGAGKSSLVNIVIGLNGKFDGELRRKPGLTVGYMPQKPNINPLMPINVRRLMALTRNCTRQQALAVLDKTAVPHLIDQPVSALSGGEMQRVMLARCLLGTPDLIVLDEPTAGVDITGEAQLYELIAKIRDDIGCSILMVSHDLHLVMSRTDQVLCLNQHLCCSGQPESVSKHPEYLALFGGQADAIAIYTHHHDHVHDLDGACDTHVHEESKGHG